MSDPSVVIEISVDGPGKFQPGNAVVKINGAVHAILRTQESFTVEIEQPEFVIHTVRPPYEPEGRWKGYQTHPSQDPRDPLSFCQ